jgi:hypothetical protein
MLSFICAALIYTDCNLRGNGSPPPIWEAIIHMAFRFLLIYKGFAGFRFGTAVRHFAPKCALFNILMHALKFNALRLCIQIEAKAKLIFAA